MKQLLTVIATLLAACFAMAQETNKTKLATASLNTAAEIQENSVAVSAVTEDEVTNNRNTGFNNYVVKKKSIFSPRKNNLRKAISFVCDCDLDATTTAGNVTTNTITVGGIVVNKASATGNLQEWQVGGSTKVMITANGDIGVGTTPMANMSLQVLKNANASVGIRFENSNTGANAFAALQFGQDFDGPYNFANLGYANPNISVYGGYRPASTFLVNNGTGGLTLASATANSDVRIYAGNITDAGYRMVVKGTTGNVGIGSDNADARLHLFKENTVSRTSVQDLLYLGTTHASVGYTGFGTGIVDYRRSYQNAIPHAINRISFIEMGNSVDDFGGAITFETKRYSSGGVAPVERMRIDHMGNVGIGVTNPSELDAKLAVNGTIRTKKVKVTQLGWPDYVFGNGYKLRSLKELEAFIVVNKHLPEVPSEKAVAKDGLDLGEMQAILLKKIEELTLYVISQDKKIHEMQVEITTLKKAKK